MMTIKAAATATIARTKAPVATVTIPPLAVDQASEVAALVDTVTIPPRAVGQVSEAATPGGMEVAALAATAMTPPRAAEEEAQAWVEVVRADTATIPPRAAGETRASEVATPVEAWAEAPVDTDKTHPWVEASAEVRVVATVTTTNPVARAIIELLRGGISCWHTSIPMMSPEKVM